MATKQAQPTRWTLGVSSEYAVIYSNPENAEMGNPNGDFVDLVYFLVAEDDRGYRRREGSTFRTKAEAKAWLPLSDSVELWDDTRPCYGSIAWQESGAEQEEIELEMREEQESYW